MLPTRIALFTSAVLLVNCGGLQDLPPIVGAARSGETERIATLAKEGADLNVRAGVNGWTPLQHAIHKNQKGSVVALVDAGADVNARGANGETPLMMAAGYGYTGIVNVLLERGADAHAQLANGTNALTLAVLGANDIDRFTAGDCQTSTVKALLDKAPDLKFVGPSGVERALTIGKIKACDGVAQLLGKR